MNDLLQSLDYETRERIFSDEDAARELVEKVRWANGVVCPHCKAEGAYKITPKKEGAKTRKGLWKCKACRKQFTVTVGTIFEDSHIKLHKWLKAIHLLCSSKKGISAHQIHRDLGIKYQSAWFMMHRIRHAMSVEPLASKLNNIVESDETWIGGKSKNMHAKEREAKIHGRGTVNKEAVVTLVERGGNVKSTHVADVNGDNLKAVLKAHVDDKARLMTDENRSYNEVGTTFAEHQRVNHSAGEYVRGDAHVNSCESVHSLLKRGVVGIYHHWSKAHLHRYLSEFDFRFNRRKVSDLERTIQALQSIEGKRLMYKQPIAK
jgi:transposase-like protein